MSNPPRINPSGIRLDSTQPTGLGSTPPNVSTDELQVGKKNESGIIRVNNAMPRATIEATAIDGKLRLGGWGTDGTLELQDGTKRVKATLTAADAKLALGGSGVPGTVALHRGEAQQPKPTVELRASDATLTLGGSGVVGTASVRGSDGKPQVELLARPNESVIGLGQAGRAGRIACYDAQPRPTVELTAADAKLTLGGHGVDGTMSVRGSDGLPLVELLGRPDECVIGLGQTARPGRISLFNGQQQEAIRIDAAKGDIFITNADCAEEFDLSVTNVEPGMVVVLTEDGGVEPCRKAYDSRVAGVVSGAGSYRPGLVLDRRDTGRQRAPVALMGKVYCWVDASKVPVRVGDLLTTSDREGHAMPASDADRVFGTVLGKALAPLSGVGLIPVLVALQ